MLMREKHNVPPSSASNQAPVPSFKVGEFGVAIGGGIWVAARDKLFGGTVKQCLEKLGFSCFLAHEDLQVSEEWKERIIEELKRVDVFVIVLSKAFKASDWCSQEIGYIVSRKDVLIVPLSVDGTTPYGFISHLQGQNVKETSSIQAVLEGALFRKRPRLMISRQIGKMRTVGSFRGAEAVVEPLVAHFARFTDEEVSDFVDAAVSNSEVWDSSGCRVDFIPAFVIANQHRIAFSERDRLLEVIEELPFAPTNTEQAGGASPR